MAGGSGTRLYPATRGVSKQPQFERLLGDGSQWGLNINYKEQPSPDGLAQAFILGEEFIGSDDCAFILGDNIFYGNLLSQYIQNAMSQSEGATIFGYQVADPERFGIASFDESGSVIAVEEKPKNPKSNWAITGLYFYDNDVVDIAKNLKPSSRGELEITDVNKVYLEKGLLSIEKLGRGYAWIDTGTHDSLLEAGEFVRVVEKRQGLKISCVEEIAYRNGFIDCERMNEIAHKHQNNGYGQYLKGLIKS